mgnify:FL=1
MPQEVVECIHTLARHSRAAPGGLEFGDRNGAPDQDDDDDDNDSDYDLNNDDDGNLDSRDDDGHDEYQNDDDGVPTAGVWDVMNTTGQDSGHTNDDGSNNDDMPWDYDDEPWDHGSDDDGDMTDGNDDESRDHTSDDGSTPEVVTTDEEEEPNLNPDESHRQLMISHLMDAKYGPRNSAYGLRPQKERNYDHRFSDCHIMYDFMMTDPTSSIALTQYSIKKGLELFGEAGAEAVIKELQQLHDRGVMVPKESSSLSSDEKRNALQYLMFLKQKRCRKIKGRGCVDGCKQ